MMLSRGANGNLRISSGVVCWKCTVWATRLERKYYKKTTLEDLDIELAVLKEFVIVASDKDYRGQKYAPPLTLHQREVWSSFNREIGCMIGGYMESVKNGPRKRNKI